MAEGVISYETFRKYQKREREKDSLQELPEDFYESCRQWMERKEKLYQKERDPSQLREIENVMGMVKDIMDRRERKMVTLALHHVRGDAAPKNLLPRERDCFDTIVQEITGMREGVLSSLRQETSAASREEEPEEKLEPPEEMEEEPEESLEEERENEEGAEDGTDGEDRGEETEEQEQKNYTQVRLSRSLDRFVGTDGEIYGPLEEGEEVEVPSDVADLLVKKDAAEVK